MFHKWLNDAVDTFETARGILYGAGTVPFSSPPNGFSFLYRILSAPYTENICGARMGHRSNKPYKTLHGTLCKVGAVPFSCPTTGFSVTMDTLQLTRSDLDIYLVVLSSDLRAECLWIPKQDTIHIYKTVVGHENGTVRTLQKTA